MEKPALNYPLRGYARAPPCASRRRFPFRLGDLIVWRAVDQEPWCAGVAARRVPFLVARSILSSACGNRLSHQAIEVCARHDRRIYSFGLIADPATSTLLGLVAEACVLQSPDWVWGQCQRAAEGRRPSCRYYNEPRAAVSTAGEHLVALRRSGAYIAHAIVAHDHLRMLRALAQRFRGLRCTTTGGVRIDLPYSALFAPSAAETRRLRSLSCATFAEAVLLYPTVAMRAFADKAFADEAGGRTPVTASTLVTTSDTSSLELSSPPRTTTPAARTRRAAAAAHRRRRRTPRRPGGRSRGRCTRRRRPL